MSRVNEMAFVHYQFNYLNCSGGVCLCSESFSLRKKENKEVEGNWCAVNSF